MKPSRPKLKCTNIASLPRTCFIYLYESDLTRFLTLTTFIYHPSWQDSKSLTTVGKAMKKPAFSLLEVM